LRQGPAEAIDLRRILDLAGSYGARTVAEGVETWADFLAVREMGFDLAQGFLFAKPMSAQKFVQTCWSSSQATLTSPHNGLRPALAFAAPEPASMSRPTRPTWCTWGRTCGGARRFEA
jgi:hypothetical protein